MSKSRKKFQLNTLDESGSLPRFCGGKLCLSEREANARINGTKRRQHYLHSKVIPKRAYYCEECGCWHLTSLPTYHESIDYAE